MVVVLVLVVVAILVAVAYGVYLGRIGTWVNAVRGQERALAARKATEREAATPRIQTYRAQRGLPLTAPVQEVVDFEDGAGNPFRQVVIRDVPTNGSPEDLTGKQRRRVKHKRLHLEGVQSGDIWGME